MRRNKLSLAGFSLNRFIPHSLERNSENQPFIVFLFFFFPSSLNQHLYSITARARFSQKSEQQSSRLIDPFSGGN